jgi:hypothetical protein
MGLNGAFSLVFRHEDVARPDSGSPLLAFPIVEQQKAVAAPHSEDPAGSARPVSRTAAGT